MEETSTKGLRLSSGAKLMLSILADCGDCPFAGLPSRSLRKRPKSPHEQQSDGSKS